MPRAINEGDEVRIYFSRAEPFVTAVVTNIPVDAGDCWHFVSIPEGKSTVMPTSSFFMLEATGVYYDLDEVWDYSHKFEKERMLLSGREEERDLLHAYLISRPCVACHARAGEDCKNETRPLTKDVHAYRVPVDFDLEVWLATLRLGMK